jgi:sterol desaturase/sphingolipid hydroxylase (fatty acid hydroxylase superfamily)
MKIFIAFSASSLSLFFFIVLFFLSFLFEVLAWQLISTSGYQVIAVVVIGSIIKFIMFDVRHSCRGK